MRTLPPLRPLRGWALPPCRAFALGALLGLGCGDDTPPNTTRATASDLDFGELDQVVDDFIQERGLEGASLAIVQRERGIVKVSGYGAFAPDRVFLIASASKILSAGVLARLADEGLLDLDAPLGDAVGAAWGDGKSTLRVAQLLSNSSGMPGLFDAPAYPPYLCQFAIRGSLSSCGQALYQANDAERVVPPDTEFHYGGAQWQLAGAVAEQASGRSWRELISDTYVEPCGAQSLGYTNPFAASGGRGYPADFEGDPSRLDATDNPNIEGGAYVNVGDYAKVLALHLSAGRCGDAAVLTEASVERMQRDRIADVYGGTTNEPALAGYGFGWWIDREHTGIVADPGLYGAVPWIDNARRYAAFIALEASSDEGLALWARAKPAIDQVFDALAQ
ncbi:MAG TPA: serine hydrolase domain-containing protein [Polyangiaceae bacterium]|nr:serine hydrolase domain-containing protein [Polyangiaceae bacterium]